MKTNGVFCIIAALLNSSKFPQSRCVQIFEEFKPYHTSSGEIKVNLYFSKIQERGKEGLALHLEKGKVLIVCYSTTFSIMCSTLMM
jgi:hypothetical protein